MLGLFKELRRLLVAVSEQQTQQAQAVAALQAQLQAVRQEMKRLAQRIDGNQVNLEARLQRAEDLQTNLTDQLVEMLFVARAAPVETLAAFHEGQTAIISTLREGQVQALQSLSQTLERCEQLSVEIREGSTSALRQLSKAEQSAAQRHDQSMQMLSSSTSDVRAAIQAATEAVSARAQSARQDDVAALRELAAALQATLRQLSEAEQSAAQRHDQSMQMLNSSTSDVRAAIHAATEAAAARAQSARQDDVAALRELAAALQAALNDLPTAAGQDFQKVESLKDILNQLMPMNSQFFHLISEIRGRVDEIGRGMDSLIVSYLASTGKSLTTPKSNRSLPQDDAAKKPEK